MEIYSVQFLGIVVIALFIHEIIGKINSKYQWIVRLSAAMLFYLVAAKWRILFLIFSSLTIYCGGKCLEKLSISIGELKKNKALSKEERKKIKSTIQNKRKLVMLIVLLANLLMLSLTKYVSPLVGFSLILPLGISFYVFMAISYIVDVYGEKYSAEDNYGKLLLYLSWFPQMLQGPINRYNLIGESLFGVSKLSWEGFKKGAMLFLFGAIKKYAVANVLFEPVEVVFAGDLSNKPGGYLLFGALLFAIQQYCDFSGGIDMMMAVSGLFGVKMSENFRQPYFSKSIAEFWRRWHISLGAFVKEYIFFPLAMSKSMNNLMKKLSGRFGKHFARAVVGGIANIIVFFIVGLWHGAQLHYVLWGLYMGIIIALSDMLVPIYDRVKSILKINNDNKVFICFQMARTFLIIVLAGYFDRISDTRSGLICFKNTLIHFEPSLSRLWILDMYNSINHLNIYIVLIGCALVLFTSILKEKQINPYKVLAKIVLPLRWVIIYAMIILLLISFTAVGKSIGFMYQMF